MFFLAGIIPACAGNTPSLSLLHVGFGDHPRVCGEHSYRLIVASVEQGSSPRVRGTLHHAERLSDLDGIIPACAGNTLG